jgi:ABC-type phosphate transport system substrate-binding protein
MVRKKQLRGLLRLFLAFVCYLSLTACYQPAPTVSGPTPTANHIPAARPPHTVVIDGSAIIGQIVQNVAQGYEAFISGDFVQHRSSGTREGFKLFCDDKTDIQMAVRVISADEAATCFRNGVDYLQITLAFDVLVVVGPAPVKDCISISELTYIFTHENLTWYTVRAVLPDQPVRVFAPPPETAAAQFFVERVLNNQVSVVAENIQELISPKGISTAEGGIGYLPIGQAQKLGDRLKRIAVDSGNGCTTPEPRSIWDGSYDYLSRPLYLYINRQSLQRGEVYRFLTYALSTEGQQWIAEAGFLPAAPEMYRAVQSTLDDARK